MRALTAREEFKHGTGERRTCNSADGGRRGAGRGQGGAVLPLNNHGNKSKGETLFGLSFWLPRGVTRYDATRLCVSTIFSVSAYSAPKALTELVTAFKMAAAARRKLAEHFQGLVMPARPKPFVEIHLTLR